VLIKHKRAAAAAQQQQQAASVYNMNAINIDTRQTKQKEPLTHSPLFQYIAKKYKNAQEEIKERKKKKRTFSTPKEISKARVLSQKMKGSNRVPKNTRKHTKCILRYHQKKRKEYSLDLKKTPKKPQIHSYTLEIHVLSSFPLYI